MTTPGFHRIRDELIRLADIGADDDVVDLGAGTGFVALAVAPAARSVLAVDVAQEMNAELLGAAAAAGLTNVTTRTADLRAFNLPPASVDVVVSNYALHHLTHADKRALLARAQRWLRPGGRIVIADMMFGRGGSPHDRKVLATKVATLLAKGPGGVWRIVKNLVRFGFGVGSERPAPPDFWLRGLRDAGFSDPRYRSVVAEAGIVSGTLARPRSSYRRARTPRAVAAPVATPNA